MLLSGHKGEKTFAGMRAVGALVKKERYVYRRCSRELLKSVRGDPELHKSYVRAYQQGDLRAADVLIEVNKPIVWKCARKFSRHCPQNFEDLLTSGQLGLLEAAARFDASRNFRPMTYFFHFIKGYIRRDLLDEGFSVRYPVNRYDGRHPLPGIGKLNIRKSYVHTFTDMAQANWDDDWPSFEEGLVDEGELAEEVLSREEIVAMMPRCLAALMLPLSGRDREIVTLYFAEAEPTLEALGKRWKITRERVRQIIWNALERMRERVRPIRAQGFDFWMTKIIRRLGDLESYDPPTLEEKREREAKELARARKIRLLNGLFRVRPWHLGLQQGVGFAVPSPANSQSKEA